MLGHLFGSKARVKILKLFLLHPEEKYYIRQVARDLGLQINSVRRELENLADFGLLISGSALDSILESETTEQLFTKTANQSKSKDKKKEELPKAEKKYYQADKNFVLYREIRDLIVKAQILYEKEFIEKITKIGQPKLLVFTGFFVNQDNASVDILIVGRFNKPKLQQLITGLEKELGREINYALMNTEEFKYRRDMTDVFLYDILEKKKILVINELDIV